MDDILHGRLDAGNYRCEVDRFGKSNLDRPDHNAFEWKLLVEADERLRWKYEAIEEDTFVIEEHTNVGARVEDAVVDGKKSEWLSRSAVMEMVGFRGGEECVGNCFLWVSCRICWQM